MDRGHPQSRYREEKGETIVNRPDPQLPDEVVKRVADAVHPVRVVLFGSAVRGNMGPKANYVLSIKRPVRYL